MTSTYGCVFKPADVNPNLTSFSIAQNDTAPAEAPVENIPIEPIDAFVEWVSAFSVALQIVAFLVGMSSRQHIVLVRISTTRQEFCILLTEFCVLIYKTSLSFVGFVIFAIMTIWLRFTSGFLSIPDLYAILARPGGAKCLSVLFSTICRYFFEFILTGAALISYSIYMISCIIKRNDDGNFDDWRLKEVAYPLVRRLATPIPARDLPRQKSCFNRILRRPWLRGSIQNDENIDIQQEGLLSGRRKRAVCSKYRILTPVRRVVLFTVNLLKDGMYLIFCIDWTDLTRSFTSAFSSPPPSVHSLFERSSDILYSSRIIIALSSCISIMLLIATTLYGLLASLQHTLEDLIATIPPAAIDVMGPEFFQFINDVAYDLPYVSAIACAIAFITIIVISVMTLQTYKRWVRRLH
jgi:hypothetical protein